MASRKHQDELTQHHIIPRSRGGGNNGCNLATVKRKYHERYHHLFENKTPEEILDFLTFYFWNGNVDHIITYMEKVVNRSVSEKAHLKQFKSLFKDTRGVN